MPYVGKGDVGVGGADGGAMTDETQRRRFACTQREDPMSVCPLVASNLLDVDSLCK